MFEITVREITTERKLVRGEHVVIDERPFTEKELAEAPYWQTTDAGKQGKLKPIYGYAPEREQEVDVQRELLKQTVEKLDLPAVIKAINNL